MAKVLVVDDDEAVRSTVRRTLEREGHVVEEAIDGRDAIDAIIHARFAVVITDVFMPGLDGIETIARIRELDPALPIIAISGRATDGFSPLEDAKLLGADRVLGKPFQVDELLGMVLELLRG